VNLYLDSSAVVKLVQAELESDALRRYLRRHRTDRFVTSTLARVEVLRAVTEGGSRALEHARRQLSRLDQIALGVVVLDRAGALSPGSPLRSLDAIHLASAQAIGPDLRAVVTYDTRMSEAAKHLRMPVVTPGLSQ
jgi:predicted nucleic acid-binding protein